MAGRTREYATNAERQAAYRERKEQARRAASAGYSDRELGQAAREMHIALQQYVVAGRYDLELLIGKTPLETMKNVSERLMPWELKFGGLCNL